MSFEPSINVISFSPYQQYHLLLCELDDTKFIVDCGWPTTTTTAPPDGSQQSNNKTRRNQQDSSEDTNVDVRRILDTINWSHIDFILVSNYEQMTLLPYITEYTEFSGPIYATEPTKTYGKCVLETTSQLLGLYSGLRDIIATMEKITDVRHDEVVSPVPFVQAYTKSSGYCIGGANWVVEYKNHRTVFISSSTMSTCLHPREWDQRVLEGANAVVFCDVAESNEDEDGGQVSQRLGQICSMALGTMKQRGGRVILVGDPYGVTQDIFQMVAENTLALNLPLPHFVFVSDIAERTLQYGNIMGEWLCERRQAMLYIPEYPFMDKELRQKGQVHFVKSLADLATRKIPHQAVSWFVVVPSNDPETIDHFVRMWKREEAHRGMDSMGASKYSLISHDPDVRRAQRLAETLACGNEMSLVPVSLRLTVEDVKRLIQGMAGCTQHVIVPSHAYVRISKNRYEFELTEYAYLQAANAQLDTDRHLPLDVQRGVTQKMRASGKQHALVSGNLSLVAGKIRLEVDEPEDDKEVTIEENKLLGQWTAEELAKALKNSEGIVEAAVIPGSQKVRVAASGGGSAIVTVDGKWSVDCTSVDIQWIILDALKQVL